MERHQSNGEAAMVARLNERSRAEVLLLWDETLPRQTWNTSNEVPLTHSTRDVMISGDVGCPFVVKIEWQLLNMVGIEKWIPGSTFVRSGSIKEIVRAKGRKMRLKINPLGNNLNPQIQLEVRRCVN